jgi:bla regulator protein blaR1
MTGIGQTNFLQALGWAVINSLWQMALLWVIYQVITGILRTNAAQKSTLATVLLLTGFSWFLYTFISLLSLGGQSTAELVVAAGFASIAANESLNEWLRVTLPIASFTYLILLVFPVWRFIRNYRYVQVIRHNGLSKVSVQWRIFVQKLAAQMGITKPVHIWVSELVSSPVTIGYLKPVILVPLAAINHLTPQQLEAVLLHELAHIRRYDYLVNLIINCIQTILYFNPFVKGFVKIVEREREKNCDEMVMQFQYDSHEYASALLILERNNLSRKTLAMAASGKKNDLLHRVELILGIRKKPILSFNKLAGLFAGLLCIIGVNAILLLSRPLNGNQGVSFTHLSSPFYLFPESEPVIFLEQPAPYIVSTHARPAVTTALPPKEKQTIASAKNQPDQQVERPLQDFINVSYEVVVEVPELKKYQEAQVKGALEASKKVLEATQWKKLEKNIADVFTQKEKEKLRIEYQRTLAKFDWNKWEDKLRQAYDQVNWDKVNEQLNKAVNNIRLDSLHKVYSATAIKLNEVQKLLAEQNMKGIPDTDISIQELQKKQCEIQKGLNNLNALRKKKVIHL